MQLRFDSSPSQMSQDMFTFQKIQATQSRKMLEVLVTFLSDELIEHKTMPNTMQGKYCCIGALLFISLSGISLLMERFLKSADGGIVKMVSTIREYFSVLIDVLTYYGGDVIGYSGGSFLTMWKLRPGKSLGDTIHQVIECAQFLQENLGVYKTPANIDIKFRIIVSGGNIQFGVVGNDEIKWFLLAGDAFWDIKTAITGTKPGDVIVTPAAWVHMRSDFYEVGKTSKGFVKIERVVYLLFDDEITILYKNKYIGCLEIVELHKITQENAGKLELYNKSMIRLEKIAPDRPTLKIALKNWQLEEIYPFIEVPVWNCVRDMQPIEYIGDILVITLQYIHIILDSNAVFPSSPVHNIVQTALDIVKTHLGVFISYSLFGRVMNMYVVYGIKGNKREMDSLNALRASGKMKDFLRKVVEVRSVSIAVTNGCLFCGVVGHPNRKNYIGIGKLLTDTRLISTVYPRRIICDYKTFQTSKLASFYFTLIDEVSHISDFEKIFCYTEETTVQCQFDAEGTLYGRGNEYNFLRKLVSTRNVSLYHGICFHGKRLIGKTAIISKFHEDLQSKRCYSIANVSLLKASKFPYFCVSQLYSQLYDQLSCIVNDDSTIILNLPRELWEPEDESNDDIAVRKYNILNHFRDIIICCNRMAIVFIDNIQHIDLQSWEILEITLADGRLKLITTATFEMESWDLKFKISTNEFIKLHELQPIGNKYVAKMVCSFLNASGVSDVFLGLINKYCEGTPGIIQSALTRMIEGNRVVFKFAVRNKEIMPVTYPWPKEKILDVETIAVLVDDKYVTQNISIAGASKELFLTYNKYKQMVIKTAAILGTLFSRQLLTKAMKRPSDLSLTKTIQSLFEEKVFECGSRYVYNTNNKDMTTKTCCRCYHYKYYYNDDQPLPPYAYCEYIYFKDTSMMKVAYNSIPRTQRKELHLFCGEQVEKSLSFCPTCIRHSLYRYITFLSFKGLVESMVNPSIAAITGEKFKSPYRTTDTIYMCVNHMIKENKTSTYKKKKSVTGTRVNPNQLKCYCIQIFVNSCKDLIYHAQGADNPQKEIFYTMLCGLAMWSLMDVQNAILMLETASNIALVDVNLPADRLTPDFRRFILGRCRVGLARIALSLKNPSQCKAHLKVALRQYNIPSVSMSYKYFKILLLRPYITKHKTSFKEYISDKNVLVRYDMSAALELCARLFLMEGKLSMAKIAATYSLSILKTVNRHVPILMDVYCTAIDIYTLCGDVEVCKKLQKRTIAQMQITYGAGITYNLNNVFALILSMYKIKYVSGEIRQALRLAYRMIDINMKMRSKLLDDDTRFSIVSLLIYSLRVKEAGYMLGVSYYHSKTPPMQNWVYAASLYFYLRAGINFFPLNDVVHILENYFAVHTSKHTNVEIMFAKFIELHYLRKEQYETSEKYNLVEDFDDNWLSDDVSVVTLLNTIECTGIWLLRSRKSNNTSVELYQKKMKTLLSMLKTATKNIYVIFYPAYLIYMAWYKILMGDKKKSKALLREAWKVAEKHDNVCYQCQILQMSNSWTGGYSFKYNVVSTADYYRGFDFTIKEWAQHVYALPLV